MSEHRAAANSAKLPLEVTRQVDSICDAYEAILQADPQAPFTPLIDRVDPTGHNVLIRHLAGLALEQRIKQGSEDPLKELLAAHPGLETQITQALAEKAAQSSKNQMTMRVRCPHCQSLVDVTPDADLGDVDCPSCGSTFELARKEGPTQDATAVTQIRQFRLIERLGVGSFGSVWKARDTTLDRTVAVKLPKTGLFDERLYKDFVKEAQAAAQLSHPGIVPVYEVGQSGDALYIVSEYVRGLTLSDWLERRQPAQEEAVEMVVQLTDALQHAHDRGVIHRDIKPGNIMIAEDGTPRLMDFGLAKRESADGTMSLDGYVIGTPAYMSPEQARGHVTAIDRRSDLYSVGVVLFQLLTGELPFQGNPRMLIHQAANEAPPRLAERDPSAPAALEAVVAKCLAKSPDDRFDSAKELGDELQRWLRGEPIASVQAAGAAGNDDQPRRNWRLTKLLLLIGLVACLVGGGFGLYSTMPWGGSRPYGSEKPPRYEEDPRLPPLREQRTRLLEERDDKRLRLEEIRREIDRWSPSVSPQVRRGLEGPERLWAAVATERLRLPISILAATALIAEVTADPNEGPAAAASVPPTSPEIEAAALTEEINQLNREIKQIDSWTMAAERGLELVKRFDAADFILMEQQQSAVAVDAQGDRFTITAIARPADMPLIQRMIAHSGRAAIADLSELARQLKQVEPGQTVTSSALISRLNEVWRARRYVPEGVSVNRMVALRRADRRFNEVGSGQHVLGYLVDADTDAETVSIATPAAIDADLGVMRFKRSDVLGFPVIAEGEELVRLEPQLEYLDYVVLRAAKELSTGTRGEHQAVAVQTDIRVNPAFVKRLSAYSKESDISWFAVARDDERIGQAVVAGGQGFEFRIVLERMAAAAENRLLEAASNLGLPLVTRDRAAMLGLLQESRIERGGSELPNARRALAAMREAADRGNLVYAMINHDGRKRRVVMRKQDEQGFQSLARQRGVHSWQGLRGGFVADAWGGGHGYGGGGAVRRTKHGVEYGYGGGGGYGGASLSLGASAARDDYVYDDGQLYQSRGYQTYLDDLNDEEARDAYSSVVYAEQVAKRDAELTLEDYGRLAHATHVLSLKVTEGSVPDTVRYQVRLRGLDGREKQLGSIELPIERSRRSVDSYLCSGELCVVNPKEKLPGSRAMASLPLEVSPRPDSTRDRVPALVVEKVSDPNGKRLGYRSLFSNKRLTGAKGWYVGAPEPIAVGKTMANVPATNRLRVAIHEIVRRIKTPAGEVVAVSEDGHTATARLIDADDHWQPGERLVAYRMSSDDDFERLPFDLRVDRRSGDLVQLACDDPSELLWSASSGLQVGDRVSARVGRRERVAVRVPTFFFPNQRVTSWDEYRLDPSASVKPELLRDDAMPDPSAVREVFRTKGWIFARGEMQAASSAVAGSVVASLRELGLEVTQTTKSGPELQAENYYQRLLDMWIVPKTSDRGRGIRFYLGMELFSRDKPATLLLEFPVDLENLKQWQPLSR